MSKRAKPDEDLIEELTEILRAIAIVSPQAYVFAGRLVNVGGPNPANLATPYTPFTPLGNINIALGAYGTLPNQQNGQGEAQSPLLVQLQGELYQSCYITSFRKGGTHEWPVVPPDEGFVQKLSEANTSRDIWDAGWLVYGQLPNGQLLAQKGDLIRGVWPGEFLMQGGMGMAPGMGAQISLYLPRESRVMQPGFYFAFGETLGDALDDMSIVRFYWNVKHEGVDELLRLLTGEFNRFGVPFRAKCLTNPAYYIRRDSLVLFVARRYYHIAAELVAALHEQIRHHMEEDTPLFTKRLADGLALAEDPGMLESFGTSRCGVLAEGIWQAFTQGAQSERERLQAVRKQFEVHGLSLERPWLNPGSIDRYTFPSMEAASA